MDEARERWIAKYGDHESFHDVGVSDGPHLSESEKWRYWRVGLVDGTRITVSFSPKDDKWSLVAMEHTKLPSQEVALRVKEYWRSFDKKTGLGWAELGVY